MTLQEIAKAMVAPGKGVLAIDESSGTIKKRFIEVGVEDSEEHRRKYRQLLITAPVERYISGMILYDETLRQKTDDGKAFPDVLRGNGIIPGIKVDTGAKPLALHEGELVTEGLDGLRERLAEYKALGAQFAKWRAVISIGADLPSEACVSSNAHALGRYAALCQEAGLVPMVEPEVLLDGDHTIRKCYDVTAHVLTRLFEELDQQGVDPAGTILKTSMVLSGKDCEDQADLTAIAEMTVRCLKENVPRNLAGIVFLSGGQSDEDSTVRLNEMNKMFRDLPWPLSFSYGRALQRPVLAAWADDMNDVDRAQRALVERSLANSLAAKGEYSAVVA